MSRNIFDLNQILGDKDATQKEAIKFEDSEFPSKDKTWDYKRSDAFEKNYEEISRSDWPKLAEKTYIRYIDLQGVMHKGCSISSITDKGDYVIFQVYSKARGNGYSTWRISSKNISKLYRFRKEDKKPKPEKEPVEVDKTSKKQEKKSIYPPQQENSLKSSTEMPKIEPIRAELPNRSENMAETTSISIDPIISVPSTMHVDIMNKKIENLEIAFQKLNTKVNSMVRVINAICERLPKNNITPMQHI